MLSRKCLWIALYAFSLFFGLNSCVDSFDPQVKNIPESFLLVDGFINSQGVTTIILSRTPKTFRYLLLTKYQLTCGKQNN